MTFSASYKAVFNMSFWGLDTGPSPQFSSAVRLFTAASMEGKVFNHLTFIYGISSGVLARFTIVSPFSSVSAYIVSPRVINPTEKWEIFIGTRSIKRRDANAMEELSRMEAKLTATMISHFS